MASSKSKESKKSGSKDKMSSEPKEDDETELCPGFKDVDSFVKVSKKKQNEEEAFTCDRLAAAVREGNVDAPVATNSRGVKS